MQRLKKHTEPGNRAILKECNKDPVTAIQHNEDLDTAMKEKDINGIPKKGFKIMTSGKCSGVREKRDRWCDQARKIIQRLGDGMKKPAKRKWL